jgi:hypothetical protein
MTHGSTINERLSQRVIMLISVGRSIARLVKSIAHASDSERKKRQTTLLCEDRLHTRVRYRPTILLHDEGCDSSEPTTDGNQSARPAAAELHSEKERPQFRRVNVADRHSRDPRVSSLGALGWRRNQRALRPPGSNNTQAEVEVARRPG